MRKVEELKWKLWPYNTCDYQGRVFNFAPDDQGKLVVSELFLGEEVEVRRINTEVDCKCKYQYYSSCCPLGDKILLMVGERYATDSLCALVSIDPGKLTKKSIHVEEKRVTGLERWKDEAYLVQISENKVWASFRWSDEIWIGELKGDELVMTKHQDHLPMIWGFGAPPLPLPDGRLLAAGGSPPCTNITLITSGERFFFEKIGDMPGKGRDSVSTILIKERFVVGFGGWNGNPVDNMWIFDLQTKKASPVVREGEWHPTVSWPFITIKDDILYIIGGVDTRLVHSTSLQHLSELIQDLDVQEAFQEALGLKLRQYPAERTDNGEFLPGMRDLGGWFPRYLSHNTVDHQGRVFHFSQREGKLCVTEILFGPWLKAREVNTGMDCKTDKNYNISCCTFGEQILVMAAKRNAANFFCALVSIDSAELNGKSIYIEEKRVVGLERWKDEAYLVQISENKVWASFRWSDEIWIGELKGEELVLTKHQDHLPMAKGFGAPPLPLPDGRLLAAGGYPYSTSITLITPGDHFSFEKIGDIPGEERDSVSTILINERFVVGFGGWNGKQDMANMWIFDLKSQKASPLAKEGEWHPATYWPFLAIKDGVLYIVNGDNSTDIHSITLQHLSELIQDLDFQPVFQAVLGLELRRYPTIHQKSRKFRGMRDLGGSFPGHFTHNTVDHQGRLLHFSQCEGKLCVTEILFEPWVKTRTVNTGIDCKTDKDRGISCCSFNDKILVMAGEENAADFFCALVSIDPGELTRESIHVEEKKVIGWKKYDGIFYLAQISEDRVWASFLDSRRIWIGELKGEELALTKHHDYLPLSNTFGSPPLRLPDGKFLAAGGYPCSTNISLITPGERFSFEKIGDMPGNERCEVSTILIKERFLVGFGGWNRVHIGNNMWIFDLKTRKESPVRKEGEWHPASDRSVLVARNKELHVIGGERVSSAHCVSFSALSHLIQRSGVRSAFCFCLGLAIQPGRGFKRNALMCFMCSVPQWL